MFDFLLANDFLSAVVAFVLVLIPAVLIHEIGHFLAAKAVGITILEFGIGLPPRMVRLFTWGGTEYTLNWLPLGGFVRPLGEDVVRQIGDEAVEQDRLEAQERGIEKTMSVNEAKPAGRILFFSAGAIANFIMAFVLFIIVALIGVPQQVGARVNVISLNENSALLDSGLQEGDIIERINGQRFASTEAFTRQLYDLDSEQVTLSVLRAVETADETTPVEPEALELSFTPQFDTTEPVTEAYTVILGVSEESPAAEAGILPGDLIVAFNGTRITQFDELRAMTQDNLEQEVTLTLRRGDELIDVSLVPRANPPQGQGAIGIASTSAAVTVDETAGFLYQEGVPQEELIPQSLGEAIQYSFERTLEVLATIVRVPAEILQGTIEAEAARPVSIVGIGQMGGVFLQESVEQDQPTIILNFIAVISIALGITNLLPLPALDGGRIFFVLLEIVRGKPIAPEREGMVHMVGLAILLSAMVVIMLNDIVNPVTELLR